MRTLNDIHGATNDDVSFYLSEIDVEEFRKHVAEFSGEQRTLRDWFAGMAMPAYMAYLTHSGVLTRSYPEVAAESYRVADAMLAARKEAAR